MKSVNTSQEEAVYQLIRGLLDIIIFNQTSRND